jgi:hypothetical protein
MPTKLTPAQLAVLREAARGDVYRSTWGGRGDRSHPRGGSGRPRSVSRQVQALKSADLLRLQSPGDRWQRQWVPTAEGTAVLEANPEARS